MSLVCLRGAWRLFLVLLCALLLAPGGRAQPVASAAVVASAAGSDKSLVRGAQLVSICANCHGAQGVSRTPDIPNLAGQQSAYLHEQMRRFADGRRKDAFMSGLIKAMSATERADAVAYLSQQALPAPVARHPHPAQVADGQRYFQQVCARCHGAEAQGGGTVPRLAGQQPGYVIKSLKRYRDGTGERIEPLMAANTRLMSDADIGSVAAYLSTLR